MKTLLIASGIYLSENVVIFLIACAILLVIAAFSRFETIRRHTEYDVQERMRKARDGWISPFEHSRLLTEKNQEIAELEKQLDRSREACADLYNKYVPYGERLKITYPRRPDEPEPRLLSEIQAERVARGWD